MCPWLFSFLFFYCQKMKGICYLPFWICFHSDKNFISPNDSFTPAEMSEGHVLGKKGGAPLKPFVSRGNAHSPKASLGQMTAEAQPAHSCPYNWSPFKRSWGVLAHNSPTLPTVRAIKLGTVQAGRRLPVLITRDKILSWCLLVKDTIAWVCSCWPESCKPSVTSTGVSERPLGPDCSSFLWLLERPHNPPTAVRHRARA